MTHGIDLLRTRDGSPVDIEVYTMNAMLRVAIVLQDADFERMIANVARHPPRVVVNHGGARVDIRDTGTAREDEALRQLVDVCSPHIMSRWTKMCHAVGLPTRVLAQRWFARQRYFY